VTACLCAEAQSVLLFWGILPFFTPVNLGHPSRGAFLVYMNPDGQTSTET